MAFGSARLRSYRRVGVASLLVFAADRCSRVCVNSRGERLLKHFVGEVFELGVGDQCLWLRRDEVEDLLAVLHRLDGDAVVDGVESWEVQSVSRLP